MGAPEAGGGTRTYTKFVSPMAASGSAMT